MKVVYRLDTTYFFNPRKTTTGLIVGLPLGPIIRSRRSDERVLSGGFFEGNLSIKGVGSFLRALYWFL